ncbi:arabinose transporter [Roseiarcus fermentans]|uniref:arabinose transporter n=1 Tax=Roseiarcus fermentans TaxID=1473586 RepID=UPI000DE842B5
MTCSSTPTAPVHGDRALRLVVWLTLALFLSFLCVAMSLPVTSVFVSTRLGFSNALAGLAVGAPFASTILTRGLAGRMSDHRGGKYCMVRGLVVYAFAALVCLAASWPGASASLAYGVLMVGRLLLGLGESLTLVGLLSWGFGIMGPQASGRVIALVGIGMYGAFAVGGPVGLALFDQAGFAGVMGAAVLVPLIGLLMALPVPAVVPAGGERPSFWRIIGRIWDPGLVVGLQGVGFAAIGAFMPLLFLHRGWSHAGFGLTCFGLAFVLMRVAFGHLPDRIGGVPVALASMAIEAVGQYLVWTASAPVVAFSGAFLTGLGCSLIFPAMGVEAVRRVPPHLRGTAIGGFAAFQDLAYGLTAPATGLLADRFGYGVVFLIGGLAATLGFATVIAIARRDRAQIV